MQFTESADGEMPVVDSASSILEQHQSSPKNVPSPVSQAEPYSRFITLQHVHACTYAGVDTMLVYCAMILEMVNVSVKQFYAD